jgi:hypothetical protein
MMRRAKSIAAGSSPIWPSTPHVRLPGAGSTGDAWEAGDAEALAALDIAIPFAKEKGLDLLVGILRPVRTDAGPHRQGAGQPVPAGTDSIDQAFAAANVRGLTIARRQPPRRCRSKPSSRRWRRCSTSACLALYQLPGDRQPRESPDLVASLARQFPGCS